MSMTIQYIPTRVIHVLACLLCTDLTLAFVQYENKSPVRNKETHLFPTFIRGTMETGGDFAWPQSYRHDERHDEFEWTPHGGGSPSSRDPWSRIFPNVKDVHHDHGGRESVFVDNFFATYDDGYCQDFTHETYQEPLHRNVKDVHRSPDRGANFEYGRSGSDVSPHFMNVNDSSNNNRNGRSGDGLWPQAYVDESDTYSSGGGQPVECDTERWQGSFRNEKDVLTTNNRKSRSPWKPIVDTNKGTWPHEAAIDTAEQEGQTAKAPNPRRSSTFSTSSSGNNRVWPHHEVATTVKTVKNKETPYTTSYTSNLEPTKDKFSSSWLERERLPKEIEKAKKKTVKILKAELKEMGIPTKSTWRKNEYVQAYSEAVVSGGWRTVAENDDGESVSDDDDAVHVVVAEKYNPEESRFSGQRPVIDV